MLISWLFNLISIDKRNYKRDEQAENIFITFSNFLKRRGYFKGYIYNNFGRKVFKIKIKS